MQSLLELTPNPTANSHESADDRADVPAGGQGLEITIHELHTSPHDTGALERDWERLFNADREAPIEQHPQFFRHELAALSGTRYPALLIAGRAAGAPVALAILVPKTIRMDRAGGFGPKWNLHGYRLAGSRILGTADIERKRMLVEAAAAEIRARRASFLSAEFVAHGGDVWNQLESSSKRGFQMYSPTGVQRQLRIKLTDTASDYWAKFSSKTRSTFRRKLKKFGEAEMLCVTEPCQVPQFLRQAHAISQKSWQAARLGLRIRNDASERQMLTWLAEQGLLRAYLLRKDSAPIAFLLGRQFRNRFHYEEVAYDPNLSRKSPGQVLLLRVLDDLFAHNPPEWFDFGGGDAEYKRLFSNHVSHSATVWLAPRRSWAGVQIGYLAACRALQQHARTLLMRAGCASWFRRRLRSLA